VGRYGFTATLVKSEIWIAGGIIDVEIVPKKYEHHLMDLRSQNDDDSWETIDGDFDEGDGDAADIYHPHQAPARAAQRRDVITDSIEYYSLKCCHSKNNGSGDTAIIKCENCLGLGGEKCMTSEQTLRVPRESLTIPLLSYLAKLLKSYRLFGRFCKLTENDLFIIGGIGYNPEGYLASMWSIDRYKFKEKEWAYYGSLEYAR